MTCRLYIDEVGNDDTRNPDERFLSLTGIITKIRGHDNHIAPAIEKLKTDLFGHKPPHKIVVLHRREIVRKESPFDCLWNEDKNAEWEQRILHLIEGLPYIAITVLIDKEEHLRRYPIWQYNPYHYCMRALVERYVLWLNSHNLEGDVVAEARFKKLDKKLKRSFNYIYDHGTEHIPHFRVQKCLTSRDIKLETKKSNLAGLQLVEMIAHPSHQNLKCQVVNVGMTARFGREVVKILEQSRYRRHAQTRQIPGYGTKILP
jgi:hypothetical protein